MSINSSDSSGSSSARLYSNSSTNNDEAIIDQVEFNLYYEQIARA
jgi:hypothetical protein